MGHYKSNLRDIEFNLFEVFGVDRSLGTGPFAALDVDSAHIGVSLSLSPDQVALSAWGQVGLTRPTRTTKANRHRQSVAQMRGRPCALGWLIRFRWWGGASSCSVAVRSPVTRR